MMKRSALLLIMLLLFAAPALAACPPLASGDLPAAVQANQQRILCLQNEVNTAARQQQWQSQLRELQMKQQTWQMQRRFDALPASPLPPTIWR